MPTVVTMNDGADCEQDGSGYRVSSEGASGPVQMVSTTRGDLRICLAIRGRRNGSTNVIPSGVLPAGVSMTLVTSGPSGTQRLETRGDGSSNTYHWFVNGREHPFDAKAKEWRDAVIALVRTDNEQAQVRGRATAARDGRGEVWTTSRGGAGGVVVAPSNRWTVTADSIRVRVADLADREAVLTESQAALAGRMRSQAARERAARASVVVTNQARAAELRSRAEAEVVARDRAAIADVVAADRARAVEWRARAMVLDSVRVRADSLAAKTIVSQMRVDSTLARVRGEQRRALEARVRRDAEARAVDVVRLEQRADSMQRAVVEVDREMAGLQARLRAEQEAERRGVTIVAPRIVMERQASDRAAEARLRAAIDQVGPR
jgi:hypothetical protein